MAVAAVGIKWPASGRRWYSVGPGEYAGGWATANGAKAIDQNDTVTYAVRKYIKVGDRIFPMVALDI